MSARLSSRETMRTESLNLCDEHVGHAWLGQPGIGANNTSALTLQRMRIFAQDDDARVARFAIAAQQRAEVVAIDECEPRLGHDECRPAIERDRERLSAILRFIDVVTDLFERRAIAS